MSELLAAIGALDRQVYLAVTTSRNAVTAVLAIALVAVNVYGLVWWLVGLGAARGRGMGRRGLWVLLTVAIGGSGAWLTAEVLKPIFARPRPFDVIASAPELLVPRPETFAFPSGDASLAFGAAVALGAVFTRLRWPALILATGIALARIAVGVHYPTDSIAGAALGTAWGLAAPPIVAAIQRRMRWRIFVVPHTHWDREWEQRLEHYRKRLVTTVAKLLDLLEREPAFRAFTFDGQTIAIEDHLAVRPQDRPRIEALIRADRLFVGPWYVLADHLLVSGESILRNFQEGLRVSGELGRAMRVAYVADPFGHPAQMPQIVRGFGYTTYVFARGVGDEGEELGSEFQWEAPSGDRVLASHQVAHYSNALALVGPSDESAATLRRRVARVLPRLMRNTAPYASGDALLFMVGDDHTEPYVRLPEAIDAIRAAQPRSDPRIASLEEFVAALPRPKGLYVGEMVAGKYRPILRGVNSTRVWIKQQNGACERLLLERCEPLDALAGGDARAELRSLWRTLLEQHPHDSICGCSIDAVHDVDMPPRFERVRRDGEALAAGLAARLAGDGDRPVVWNSLPWPRTAVVDVAGRPTLVACAALGVRAVEPVGGAQVSSPADGVIENEHLRVEVAEDGSFSVLDARTGRRSGRQNLFVDEGDRGDQYTSSYAGPTESSAGLAGRRTTRVAGDRASVTVELTLPLPAGLRADRLARSPDLVECPVRTTISLDAAADRVEVTTEVDNRARDHRLRVFFETGTRTLTHLAGAAFALLERPNRVPPKTAWVEPPTPERCVHDVVAVRGATTGLAVGVDGLRDYAVLHGGATIAITLIRAVGWLSRGDLRERRGHAGSALETPSAQMIGKWTFRYCVIPLDPDRATASVVRGVREFLSPPWLARGSGEGRTFLSIEDGEGATALSALRAGRDGALILRLVNPSAEASRTAVRFQRRISSSRPVDLREGVTSLGNTGLEVIRTAAPLEIRDDGSAVAALQPYEIGTWEIYLR